MEAMNSWPRILRTSRNWSNAGGRVRSHLVLIFQDLGTEVYRCLESSFRDPSAIYKLSMCFPNCTLKVGTQHQLLWEPWYVGIPEKETRGFDIIILSSIVS